MVDLNHIGVIVTRPLGQSERLMELISNHHGRAFEVPCLLISEVADKRKARNRIKQVKNYDYLLFTSPNSVSHALKLGLDLEGDFKLIAIGTGTRNALLEHCDREIIQAPKPYTSEALVEKLKEEALTDKKILLISGEGGRRILGDSLRDDYGAITDYVDVYRREKPRSFNLSPALAHAEKGNPLVLLITSQEALDNVDPLIQSMGLKEYLTTLIVGSERLANHAKSLSYESIIIAPSALEDDMWQALCDHSEEILGENSNHSDEEVEEELFSFTLSESDETEMDDMTKKDTDNNKEQLIDDIDHNKTEDETLIDTTTIESALENKDQNEDPIKIEDAVDEMATENKTDREKTPVSPETPTPTQTNHSQNNKEVIVKKSGSAISWIALILALGAAGISGYQYYESMEADKTASVDADNSTVIDQLNLELSTLKKDYNRLSQQVTSMPQSIPEFPVSTSEIEDLKRQMNKLSELDQFDTALNQLQTTYNQRVNNLEEKNNTLQEQLTQFKSSLSTIETELSAQDDLMGDSNRLAQKADDIASSFEAKLEEELSKQRAIVSDAEQLIRSLKNTTDVEALRLTEIEYLLNFAAYKLTFETDIKAVAYALQEAKDRLESITSLNVKETLNRLNPRLEQLNKLIENPINLESYATQILKAEDLVKHALFAEELTIGEFRKELAKKEKSNKEEAETQEDRRWYHDIKDTLSPLFIVQERRIEDPQFISNQDAQMIQQNILLQLTTARLAILQNQTSAFKESITQARTWLDQYYDHADDNTNQAIALLDSLIDVKTSYSSDDLPDIDPIRSIYRATRNVNSEGEQ